MYFLVIYAVFRLERATEVLELTYLGKYFACVNANWYPGKHRSRQYQVKVRFTLRAGMVKVGNQGLDDRYIRLRSHRISHPLLSGLRQSHSITFSNVRLDILKFSFHHSSTKFLFNRVSNQNWFLGHDHARLTRLVLRRAICSRINRFRLDLFRCCKRKSCCNLDSWVCCSRTRK